MSRWHQRAIYAFVALSLAFVVVDSVRDWHLHRADLQLESLARLFMLVVAVLAAYLTRGHHHTRLLMWGLVGLSFDVYWETAYGYAGFQWVAMAIKYLGVPFGLVCVTRLAATFGEGPRSGVRELIYRAAPAMGVVVAALGLLHGYLYITNCYRVGGGCEFISTLAIRSYGWYVVADALIRIVTIAAAVIGLFSSSEKYRSRLVLIAGSCVLLATGTSIDFLARVVPPATVWISGLQYVDAVTTLLFPIGLLIALLRRQLFDLDYVIRRWLAFTIAAGFVVITFAVCEQLLQIALSRFTWPIGPRWLPEVLVGVAITLLFKPVDKLSMESIDRYILPDRKKRLDALRRLAAKLALTDNIADLTRQLETLKKSAGASFADVFLRDAGGDYAPFTWSTEVRPALVAGTASAVQRLSAGKAVRLKERNRTIPKAHLLLPMPVAGKLFGILACGRKYLDSEDDRYDPAEIGELEAVARQAGAALYALHATV
ncbi:MAG TPA: hypothetical protein VIN40_08205 [Candidatus Tyrphobacter sp.]